MIERVLCLQLGLHKLLNYEVMDFRNHKWITSICVCVFVTCHFVTSLCNFFPLSLQFSAASFDILPFNFPKGWKGFPSMPGNLLSMSHCKQWCKVFVQYLYLPWVPSLLPEQQSMQHTLWCASWSYLKKNLLLVFICSASCSLNCFFACLLVGFLQWSLQNVCIFLLSLQLFERSLLSFLMTLLTFPFFCCLYWNIFLTNGVPWPCASNIIFLNSFCASYKEWILWATPFCCFVRIFHFYVFPALKATYKYSQLF